MTITKQTRRIVGQCGQADFVSIEHLAIALEKPEMLDTSTLTNRQKFAFHFLEMAQRKHISWKLLRAVVREVLFWGDDTDVSAIEIKPVRDKARSKEAAELRRLWGATRIERR